METDGEGGGGGEAERRGRSELRRLLEAIGSSEVLEKRIPLVKQLEEGFSADDLGVSHCTLHRSVLQVALKCSDLDITDHLRQFLTLGAKASSWCGKHLQWSAKCTDQSQTVEEEEHNRLYLEINSLSLSISTKLLDIAAKCIAPPTSGRVAPAVPVHTLLVGEHTILAPGAGWNGHAVQCVLASVQARPAAALQPPPRPGPLFEKTPPVYALRVGEDAKVAPRAGWPQHAVQWLSNKDAFPSVETMAVEVEEKASAPDEPRATTKGRRRVTASETACRHANVLPHGDLCAEKETVWRCIRCAAEKTPQWREGPDGPGTLCNACGLVFRKKRRLLPEYRPANTPAFSPPSPRAHGSMSSPLQRHSSLRRVLKEDTLAAGRVTAGEVRRGEDSMEVQLLPERPRADNPAFSLVSHGPVLKRRRKSEAQTFARIRATAKAGRADRAAARLAAMDN